MKLGHFGMYPNRAFLSRFGRLETLEGGGGTWYDPIGITSAADDAIGTFLEDPLADISNNFSGNGQGSYGQLFEGTNGLSAILGDPIIGGGINPIGQWTENSLDVAGDIGGQEFRDLGSDINQVAPYIAAAIAAYFTWGGSLAATGAASAEGGAAAGGAAEGLGSGLSLTGGSTGLSATGGTTGLSAAGTYGVAESSPLLQQIAAQYGVSASTLASEISSANANGVLGDILTSQGVNPETVNSAGMVNVDPATTTTNLGTTMADVSANTSAINEASLQDLLDQSLGANYNADLAGITSSPVDTAEIAKILAENAQSGGLSLQDVYNGIKSGKTINDLLTGANNNSALQSIGNLINGAYSSYAQSQLADKQSELAKWIVQNADPYRQYRQQTEIPFMQSMLEKAPGLMTSAEQTGQNAADMLNNQFYQNKLQESYTNPLAVYNSPEMQALNAQFLNGIERRDAAAGRNSQYGARALESQNNFLTNVLPTYRTGLTTGENALSQQGSALGNLFGNQANYATGIAKLGTPSSSSDAGSLASTYGNLGTSANTAGSNALAPLLSTTTTTSGTGANQTTNTINNAASTINGLQNLWNTGTKAWNSLSSLFG